jgi:ATP-dependent helicase Lhr and Lhr-like helicase
LSGFERLHPAVQHHVVNSLGFRALRPLQEAAIEPLMSGSHALLLAPTAGGKTEAAIFPILSRMLEEDWRGLSVLYVCPIRALLNNLEVRLHQYCDLLGRSAALWHGDVRQSDKARFLAEPADVLLTTPESLEVMLVSRRIDHRAAFANVRVVVVDELHAFAGDDRGSHLLSVLQRIERLTGRSFQRVGLSATVGNPEELLRWLAPGHDVPRQVIAASGESLSAPEIALDFVGTIANAALVISQLHRGEKRLVFCDSRTRVEELASELRRLDVDTYVSHSSLSLDERRRAEAAFAQGYNCVIVATSTLELGIDVGDLDRVIQIDAPWTVSAFLQRLGRTGRRPGSIRNCLFLATKPDALLRAAAIIDLASRGYCEPVVPPPLPYQVFAQQILALALQEEGIGRADWRAWLKGVPGFDAMTPESLDRIVDHMLSESLLFEDGGVLGIGTEGEKSYGHKNFLELFSIFTTPPLFRVLHGRTELGEVDAASFQVRSEGRPVVILAGRNWQVTHIDWRQHVAYVEPEVMEEKGRSRWPGSGGALHFELCRAVRRVLTGVDPKAEISARARRALDEAREPFPWLDDTSTVVVRSGSAAPRWWTFSGYRVNSALARLSAVGNGARASDTGIALGGRADLTKLEREVRRLSTEGASVWPKAPIAPEMARELKFEKCLPPELVSEMLAARVDDTVGMRRTLAEPVRVVSVEG